MRLQLTPRRQLRASAGILPCRIRWWLSFFCLLVFGLFGWLNPSAAQQQSGGEIGGTIEAGKPVVGDIDWTRTVVFLDSHARLAPHEANHRNPVIAQKDKKFVPDMLVISRGTAVEFPNRDPFSHNVFSRSQAARFDLDRYAQGTSKSYRFEEVGLIQLFCNIHPKMRAVIMIVPNRYFTFANEDGSFTIQGIPPGQYSLVVWHATTGSIKQTINIVANQKMKTQITLNPRVVRRRTAKRGRSGDAGVSKGLGVKQERLNLPVVSKSFPSTKKK